MTDGALEIDFDRNRKLKITMIIVSLKLKTRKKSQFDPCCAILFDIFLCFCTVIMPGIYKLSFNGIKPSKNRTKSIIHGIC